MKNTINRRSAAKSLIIDNIYEKSSTTILEGSTGDNLGKGSYKKFVYIYSLEDPITNKIRYIGKTKQEPKYRLSSHLYDKTKCYRTNWIKSLKNKGLIPIIDIIDIVLEEEWKFWEKYYISLFKSWNFNLVNSTDGGDDVSQLEDNSISIKCFNLDLTIYKNYKSIIEASNNFNCNSSHISECCNGKIRTYMNKICRYKEDDLYKYPISSKKKKRILQYDLYGNFIKEYNSIKEATLAFNCKESYISRVLRGERNKYKNYKFFYKDIV